jgi:hypothetical protein
MMEVAVSNSASELTNLINTIQQTTTNSNTASSIINNKCSPTPTNTNTNTNTNTTTSEAIHFSNTNLTTSENTNLPSLSLSTQQQQNSTNNNSNSNNNGPSSYAKTALTSNLSISNRSSGTNGGGSCGGGGGGGGRSATNNNNNNNNNGRPRKPGSNYVFKEENIQSYTDANGVVYKVAGYLLDFFKLFYCIISISIAEAY